MVVLSFVTAAPHAFGQSGHAAPPSALDAALQQRVDQTAADRADVLRVLARPEVKAVAGKAGIDLRRASGAVATLSGTQLAEVTAQARQVDQALAGGASTVVISTTTIIIALLILILIIIAAK
jgi:hypothetical protein